MAKRTFARTNGKGVYTHKDASVAYRRLSEPMVWDGEEGHTSGFHIALVILALCGTLGVIGWLFTIT